MKTKSIRNTALLMLLHTLLPGVSHLLAAENSTLDSMSTSDVLAYLQAVIKTGISSEANCEMLYVLGNTNIGKTSLVETLSAFIRNPTRKPKSVLTEDHTNLLETRIVEVYSDMAVQKVKTCDIKLREEKNIKLIDFQETVTVTEPVKVTKTNPANAS